MTRTGRNDLCPCGSGKKYKNCCLNKDRIAHLRDTSWIRDEQATVQKLLAFAQRPAFHSQMVVASNLFWNGNYGAAGLEAIERDEALRFADWYVFDYRMEGLGKRAVDLFAEEMGPTLLPEERERVRIWQDSYLSLYMIAGSSDSGLLPVLDLLQERGSSVSGGELGRLGLRGDVVLGRILRSPNPEHFSWGAVLLPGTLKAGLMDVARRAFTEYGQTHAEGQWAKFLSAYGYIFNHALLKMATEAGGPRRASPAYYDGFRTMERLREVERRLREQAAKEWQKQRLAQERQTEKQEEPVHQTRGGILLPKHVQYRGSRKVKA